MSVKIKVSYTTPQELHRVIAALSPLGITWKTAKRQEGRFKNAYVELQGNATLESR